jgi:hypothetical protein
VKKSKSRGKISLKCEVTNISPFGIWLLLDGHEYFLNHKKFPWFRKASVEDTLKVKALTPTHIYWPELDIDLHVESIKDTEQYPLVSKTYNKKLISNRKLNRKLA